MFNENTQIFYLNENILFNIFTELDILKFIITDSLEYSLFCDLI